MFKKLIGIALIIAAFVVEAMWLGAAFGSVVVGVVLLIFAPAILLLPFNVLFAMGVAFLAYEEDTYSRSSYSDYDSYSHSSYQNDSYDYEEDTASSYSYTNMNQYYDTLGCNPEDDFNTIKAAYKALSKKFHPDSIQGKGLDSEFVRFATEKMKAINEAYMKIRSVRQAA